MGARESLPEGRTWSFKEIDARHACPKGTAFRAFKRLGAELEEGRHFHYFAANTHAALIAELKAEGRIYASTLNAVLLTEAGYERLRAHLPRGKE